MALSRGDAGCAFMSPLNLNISAARFGARGKLELTLSNSVIFLINRPEQSIVVGQGISLC